MSTARKIAIVLVSVAILSLGYVMYNRNRKSEQLDLTGDGLGAERNKDRSYAFLLSGSGASGLSTIFGFNPGSIPVSSSYQPWLLDSDPAFDRAQRDQNMKNALWLKQVFDANILEISKSVKLPRCLIYAVLLAETGSVANRAGYDKVRYNQLVAANPSGAIGPMQVKPITATETVQISLNKGFIADYHIEVLQDTLGVQRANQIFVREKPGSKYFADNKIIAYGSGKKKELLDDKLNLMIASLKLINLIDNYGEKNLHQVFYAYNQGDRTVIARDLKRFTAVRDFQRNVSGEGKAYINRILGTHGSLDIIINDLNIFA